MEQIPQSKNRLISFSGPEGRIGHPKGTFGFMYIFAPSKFQSRHLKTRGVGYVHLLRGDKKLPC